MFSSHEQRIITNLPCWKDHYQPFSHLSLGIQISSKLETAEATRLGIGFKCHNSLLKRTFLHSTHFKSRTHRTPLEIGCV